MRCDLIEAKHNVTVIIILNIGLHIAPLLFVIEDVRHKLINN